MSAPLAFPESFVFGVATAAYQVEGGIENDWSDWERAGKLNEPHVRCGRSVDHWNRFSDDVGLIQQVGGTAYRMSIEWARVEPEPGRFDDAAWAQYRERLELLCARKIRPVVTLHHFTHPKWFHVKCPWHEPACLAAWERYVKKCAELVDGLDVAVVTFNEPMVFLLGGYLSGKIPPGIADARKAWPVLCNLARAHVIARQALMDRSQKVTVGISQHLMDFVPARRWHPIDQALSRLSETNFNHALLEALSTGDLRIQFPGISTGKTRIDGARSSMDYIGINYYTRSHLKFVTSKPFIEFNFRDVHKRGLTDIGWEYYPEGFGRLLRTLRHYPQPIWVTENGIDDRTGQRRTRFLHDHLKQILDARADGINVQAYLHWSLLDNFEWLEGWGPRFGLFRVDFETLERTATPACDYFRTVATTRILPPL
jgi:beta-glucosidase